MSSSMFNANKTAVITGGASGIGLATAKKCFSRGMKVLIADKDVSLLEAAKSGFGESLHTFHLDVSKLADWQKLNQHVTHEFGGTIPVLTISAGQRSVGAFEKTDRQIGHVDFLFLNAGIQPHSNWNDVDAFRKTFDVNLFGVVNGITTMLPMLKSQTDSTIVITGSKQGITNPPGNPAYNASKAALNSVAEQLSYDLRQTTIKFHLLVPGWTFTGLGGGFPTSQKPKPAAAWTPEQVVDFMEQKMEKGDFYIICPDNEVTEQIDKKRILWSAGDIIHSRPALSRWRSEFQDQVSNWMAKPDVE